MALLTHKPSGCYLINQDETSCTNLKSFDLQHPLACSITTRGYFRVWSGPRAALWSLPLRTISLARLGIPPQRHHRRLCRYPPVFEFMLVIVIGYCPPRTQGHHNHIGPRHFGGRGRLRFRDFGPSRPPLSAIALSYWFAVSLALYSRPAVGILNWPD